VGTEFNYVYFDTDLVSRFDYLPVNVRSIKDTLFQGRTCKQLKGNLPYWSWNCNGTDNATHYMYEDEGQVYYWNFDYEEFRLLYDFDALPYESYTILPFCKSGSYCNFDSIVVEILNIGQEEIDTKVLDFQDVLIDIHSESNFSPFELRIYRGIGIKWNMFYMNPGFCATFHSKLKGICSYSSPETGYIEFSENTSCDQIVSNEILNDINYLIYPNPTDTYLHIEWGNLFTIDILDKDLKKCLSTSEHLNTGKIDISMLPNGIYYLRIKGQYKNTISKIIKI